MTLLIVVLPNSLLSQSPLDKTSFSVVAQSLRAEEGLPEAKNPASAGAKQSAGTATVNREPGTGVQTGTARSGTEVTLPSNGENGAMHMGTEKVTNNDQSNVSASYLISCYSLYNYTLYCLYLMLQ